MVTGLPWGETHRARREGSSSQQLEHSLVPAPENHGAHFNVLLHTSWSRSDGFSTSTAGGEHNRSSEWVHVGVFPGWFLIWGDHLPGPAGLAHYSAVQPWERLASEPAEGSSACCSDGMKRILLFKTHHPSTGWAFSTDHLPHPFHQILSPSSGSLSGKIWIWASLWTVLNNI